MLLHSLLLCALSLCAAARQISNLDASTNASSLLRDPPNVLANDTPIPSANIIWKTDDEPKDDADKTEEERWCGYFNRGLSLMKAMMMDEDEARRELGWGYIQSIWDGDMRQDLATWGYEDSDGEHQEHDVDCDFTNEGKHQLEHVFRDLRTDPRSAGEGGPNRCFHVGHSNSPAIIRDQDNEIPFFVRDQRYMVGATEYKATGARAAIGVNSTDGFLYFNNLLSAERAARSNWGYKPTPHDLPALRSTSDIAFAFWNRATSAANRKNLKYIMSNMIINDYTEKTIEMALEAVNGGDSKVRAWPGTDFEFNFGPNRGAEIEGALALLGSPNGIAAAYFCIQHRRQLGRKFISKVRVFNGDDDDDDNEYPDIYMIFYVSDQAPWEGPVSRIDAELRNSHAQSCRKCSEKGAPSEKRKTSKAKKVKKVKKVHKRTAL